MKNNTHTPSPFLLNLLGMSVVLAGTVFAVGTTMAPLRGQLMHSSAPVPSLPASHWTQSPLPLAPTLAPTVKITSSYVAKGECNPTFVDCTPLLWLTLLGLDGEPLQRHHSVSGSLHSWSETLRDYEWQGAPFVPVYNTHDDLRALSFPLNKISATAPFPVKQYYILKLQLGQNEAWWSVKIDYHERGAVPHVWVSKPSEKWEPPAEAAHIPAIPSQPDESDTESEVPSPSPLAVHFPDLIPGTRIDTAAAFLASRGVVRGYPDGTFRPIRHVNRAEAAKLLLSARYGEDALPVLGNQGQFWDVVDGEWYVPYVMYAAQLGIIDGYPDGSFRPADTVNTAEFLKMITLAYGLDENVSHEFIDVTNADWFDRYAGAVRHYDLLPKRPSFLLLPDMLMTREEVVIAIYQALSQVTFSL